MFSSASSSSSSSSSSRKMLAFKSSEGKVFRIKGPAIIPQSKTIAALVKEGWLGGPTPLPWVSTEALDRVIKYCNKHHASGPGNGDLHKWDTKFVDLGGYAPLLDLIMAADLLGIKTLLDLGCEAVASMIESSSRGENIRSASTPKTPQPRKRRSPKRSEPAAPAGVRPKRSRLNQ